MCREKLHQPHSYVDTALWSKMCCIINSTLRLQIICDDGCLISNTDEKWLDCAHNYRMFGGSSLAQRLVGSKRWLIQALSLSNVHFFLFCIESVYVILIQSCQTSLLNHSLCCLNLSPCMQWNTFHRSSVKHSLRQRLCMHAVHANANTLICTQ